MLKKTPISFAHYLWPHRFTAILYWSTLTGDVSAKPPFSQLRPETRSERTSVASKSATIQNTSVLHSNFR